VKKKAEFPIGMFHFWVVLIWIYRGHTKVGLTADECKGAYHISCQKSSSGYSFLHNRE